MRRRGALASVVLSALLAGAAAVAAPAPDAVVRRAPLAAEISRWSAYLRENRSSNESWTAIRRVSDPVLAAARDALARGRLLLAFQKLAAARMYLSGFAWVESIPAAQRRTPGQLEAEWARTGRALRSGLATPSPDAFGGLRPAAVRGIAETAAPQVREYYDASLEYGRSTTADSGFLYLAAARAQRELIADLCRAVSVDAGLPAPRLRSLAAELDALEGELLAAYRPPDAIDRHSDFIAASSVVKEARELDGAGLRYGALLRYLLAAQRTASLRPTPPPPAATALKEKLAALDSLLSAGGIDHSIGRLFLESARAEVESAGAGRPSPVAAAIVSDVMPRYFAALLPGRPLPERLAARATVTLVRWPYT